MSGLTWLHIPDWLWKGEKEFDRQVIRAALIRDIRGRTSIGPDLSMIDLLDPLLKACDAGPDSSSWFLGAMTWIELFLKNFRPRSRSLLDPREVRRKI